MSTECLLNVRLASLAYSINVTEDANFAVVRTTVLPDFAVPTTCCWASLFLADDRRSAAAAAAVAAAGPVKR
jgi:hypothetical protein